MTETDATRLEKVVVQFGNRTIRGYLETPAWNTIEEMLHSAPDGSPETFRIRGHESDTVEEISAADIKAVFYVNSFEGDSEHNNLNFHTRAPIVHGIWMRVEFYDGEIIEGIVFNSIRYLVDPGFFLIPTDPESNNKLLYVMKNQLADLRVLGVRKLKLRSQLSENRILEDFRCNARQTA
jgi:hypothetical protein